VTAQGIAAARGRRPMRRRAVIAIPSGLTLANLFFGIFAIVSAARGELSRAGLFVVFAGIFDVFDGRVARATNSGTPLGEELDSLVDLVSFGLAPAMIMYFAVLNRNGWDWVWVFAYVACAALRLARFNIEQAGRAKEYFHGLPSPAAGLTLATYYWFSQTSLYNDTNIAELDWHTTLRFVMAGLGALMVSNVSYPAVPTVGFRTPKQILGTLVILATIVGVFVVPKQFFFPACLAYVVFGFAKTVFWGLLGRRASGDSPVITEDHEDHELAEPHHHVAAHVAGDASARRRRRRRRPRGPGQRHDRDGTDSPPTSP
jgi:CDP-diacylglycerol--serine O-phosphatidyltransferase